MNKEKFGLVDSDIIQIIRWKKATEKEREKMVCNQLSMLENQDFHDYWWKLQAVNKELYWEMQYLYLDHDYFRNKIFKIRAWKALKQLKFKEVLAIFVDWAMWNTTVTTNYEIFVKLPYKIRTNTL